MPSAVMLGNRLRARDLAAAEVLHAATLLVGDLTGLAVGSELYEKSLPPEIREGFALSLTGVTGRTKFDFSTWNIRFYGRADVMETLLFREGMLCAKLPLPLPVSVAENALAGDVLIADLTPGKVKTESVSGSGAPAFAFQMDLTVEAAAD